MSLWIVSLLLGVLPIAGANVTSDPSHLVFGKMWMEGGCRAQLAQRLHVEVKNNGDQDYNGSWVAYDVKTGNKYGTAGTYASSVMFETLIASGETRDVTIDLLFEQAGNYQMKLVSPEQKEPLFTYEADIAEYQEPRLTATIKLDMLDQTDNGNFYYGELNNGKDYEGLYGPTAFLHLTGTVTLTNEGNEPIFSFGRWEQSSTGIYVQADPSLDDDVMAANLMTLTSELRSGETITRDFQFNLSGTYQEDDHEYYIEVGMMDRTILRIPFVLRESLNTYWTADGHARPLPVSDNALLKIPAEALAVDMRGQHRTNTVFSIDATEANPNCLYFLDYLDNVPRGFASETNIIRGEEAKTLIVDAERDYFCPMPFRARTALFTYTPVSEVMGPAQLYMSQIMSAAFILPFDAQDGMLSWTNGGKEPVFFNDDLKVYGCDGMQNGKPAFRRVTGPLKAYTPYLMYVKPSPVVFLAENVTVPATRQSTTTISHDGVDYYELSASTKEEPVNKQNYLWSCDRYYFYHGDDNMQIRPFNVELHKLLTQSGENVGPVPVDPVPTVPVPTPTPVGPSDVILIYRDDAEDGGIAEDSPTVIQAADAGNSDRLTVYSLSGQLAGTATYIDGHIKVEGLKPGLYIAAGRKIVIK